MRMTLRIAILLAVICLPAMVFGEEGTCVYKGKP
jgi:hypothetical protein